MASLDPASSSRQELLYLFAQFGELREMREDPLRPNCCLVEYYDTRHAGGWVGVVVWVATLVGIKKAVLDGGLRGQGLQKNAAVPSHRMHPC